MSMWVKGVGLTSLLGAVFLMKDRHDSNVEEWHTECLHHQEHAFYENMLRAKKAYSGNNFFTKVYLWWSDSTWFLHLKEWIHMKKRFFEHVILDNIIPIGLGVTGFSIAFPRAAGGILRGVGRMIGSGFRVLGALGSAIGRAWRALPPFNLTNRFINALSRLTPAGLGVGLAGVGMAAYFLYRLKGEFNGRNQMHTFHDIVKGPMYDGSKYPGLGEGGGGH